MEPIMRKVGVLLLVCLLFFSLFVLTASASNESLAEHFGLSETDYQEFAKTLQSAIDRLDQEHINLEKYNLKTSCLEWISTLIHQNYRNCNAELQSWTYAGEKLIDIKFQYYYTAEQCKAYDKIADKLLEGIIGSSLTDLEKALLVHDRLVVWCAYDSVGYHTGNIVKDSYHQYGALVQRTAVCQGYAEAFDYMMGKLGIPCRTTRSESLNHMWNIITIDGKEYHLDCGFDDPIEDIIGRVEHTYFLDSTAKVNSYPRHRASDFDASPSSTRFDNMFWNEIHSSFVLLNGKIYFVKTAENEKAIYEWNGGNPVLVYSLAGLEDARWYTSYGDGSYWPDSYTRLSADSQALYFSMAKNIYRLVPGSTPEIVYSPSELDKPGMSFYGFRMEDGWFICRIGDDPNTLSSKEDATLLRYNYVGAPKLVSIAVGKKPQKTTYSAGEKLNTTGMTLLLTYSDGSKKEISSGFTVSGYNEKTVGTQNLTVTYGKYTTKLSVTVNPAVLSSVAIAKKPAKTVYQIGEKLDTTGLTLRLTYSDGTVKDVTTGFTVSSLNSSASGEKTLTVTYEGKTASFTVTVNPKAVASISLVKAPDQTSILIGETPDTTGMVLRLTYEDGTSEEVRDGFELSLPDLSKAGQKNITVKVQGKSVTYPLTVIQPKLTLSVSELTMAVGGTYTIQAEAEPTGADITFSTSKRAVAFADGAVVTARQPGEAVITVKADYGSVSITETCKVTVIALSDADQENLAVFLDCLDKLEPLTEENYQVQTGYITTAREKYESLSDAAKILLSHEQIQILTDAEQALVVFTSQMNGKDPQTSDSVDSSAGEETTAPSKDSGTAETIYSDDPQETKDSSEPTGPAPVLPEGSLGIVIAVLVLAVGGVIIICVLKKKKKSEPEEGKSSDDKQ